MTGSSSRRGLAKCLVPLLLAGVSACAPDAGEGLGGLFTAEEAEALHEQWDYVEGWFGGDIMRYGHLNVDRLFPTVVLRGDGPLVELTEAPRDAVSAFVVNTKDRGEVTLDDYITNDSRVDGFIVLNGDEIVYERYPHMRPDDRHLYFSVSKMVNGLLISKLEDQGLIDVSATVERYVPALTGTAWEGITIRNVLDMASGIGCYENTEAYADIESCFMVMERSVGFQPELPTVSFREHLATAPRGYEQGTRFDYTSANTSMLMYLAEVVTGRTYPELVSDMVWSEVGAERAALMVSGAYSAGEAAAAHSGFFTTLRDMGRLGLFMLEQSEFHRKLMDDARPQLFAPESVEAAFVPLEPAYETAGDRPTHAAWQCDVVFPDGDFGKGGYGGQFLHVSPSRDLVIAWFGTFGEDMVEPDLQSVARQLSTAAELWNSR